jgi:hypothetical protein
MLLEEIKAIKSEKKDLRNFGLTIGIAFAVLGGMLWWKGKDTYAVFMILSFAFILFGLLLPAVLKPLQKVWMILAVIIGWFMTRVILSVLFFLVFTTISLISRLLLRKQFLNLKIDKSLNSYWIRREVKPFDASDYERQF